VRDETGLDVPISGAGGAVGDVPWNYDERLVRVLPDLRKLIVLALEKHDIALSKAVRGEPNDLDAVAELHRGTTTPSASGAALIGTSSN
jgi:hypothetical protein